MFGILIGYYHKNSFEEDKELYQTANTTRLPYSDPELLSIGVSQFLYPSDTAPWRANSVILIIGNDFRLIVPGVSFVHFPVRTSLKSKQPLQMFKGCLHFIYRFINSVYPFFHPFISLLDPSSFPRNLQR